jgi:DNA-directed RNA polymerase subunit RPC12/RpoP
MSDRYILDINCAYCNFLNEGVLFNLEWADTFICVKCSKENYIKPSFKAYKTIIDKIAKEDK